MERLCYYLMCKFIWIIFKAEAGLYWTKSASRSVDKEKFRNDAEFEYLPTLETERAIKIQETIVYRYFLRTVLLKCLYILPKNTSAICFYGDHGRPFLLVTLYFFSKTLKTESPTKIKIIKTRRINKSNNKISRTKINNNRNAL